MTTILAQISDPHMRVGPDDQGSASALVRAVEAVLALDPLPDAVLISGDLADTGAAAEYERVRELLTPLPMPVHVLPGNHDHLDWDGPYAADVGELRLIACDTTKPGEDDGRLDLEWLEAQLAASPAPTIVAMHHPPLLTGIGGLDAIGLPPGQRAALGALLGRSPHVRRVAAGHVHRARSPRSAATRSRRARARTCRRSSRSALPASRSCPSRRPSSSTPPTSRTSSLFRGLPDAGRPALRLAGPHEEDAPHDRRGRPRRRRPCRRR